LAVGARLGCTPWGALAAMGRASDSESEFTDSDAEDVFKDRHSCTDIPCFGLFVASVAAFFVLLSWASVHGNTNKLNHGIDKDGRICGVSPGVEDKPFMYYCPLKLIAIERELEVDLKKPVCVAACPTGSFDPYTNTSVVTPYTVAECEGTIQPAYLTEPVQKRFCLPSKAFSNTAFRTFSNSLSDFWQQLSEDRFGTRHCWPVLLLVLVAATALGYAYLFLLRAVAQGLIWIATAVSMLVLLWSGYKLWFSEPLMMGPDGQPLVGPNGLIDTGSMGGDNAVSIHRAIAVVLWILALIVALLACCFGNSVKLSTACVRQGVIVMWKMPLMLAAPFVKALVKTILAVIFLLGWVHLLSIGEVTGLGLHRTLKFTGQQWMYLIFYVYTAFWILQYVSALYQFAIAYCVARWYMTPPDEYDHRDVVCCGVQEGVFIGITKHTGSLAFGSAVIAAMEVFQKVLEWADAKNKQEANNQAVECILKTCLCLCTCLEGIIQFINKNAYIDIAITSDGFCKAVRNVMHVVIDHGAAMAILNAATYIFQIVGMLSITGLCGLLSYAVLQSPAYSDPESSWYVESTTLTVTLSCIIAFIVAWAFMSIFDTTTDTLLYCFADDKRAHNGQVTTAPSDFVNLYNEAEVTLQKRAAQRERQLAKEAKYSDPVS